MRNNMPVIESTVTEQNGTMPANGAPVKEADQSADDTAAYHQ